MAKTKRRTAKQRIASIKNLEMARKKKKKKGKKKRSGPYGGMGSIRMSTGFTYS